MEPKERLELNTPATRYVVGFPFTNDGRVLLVTKLRPKWQHGCLNGIGGKIEDGETPVRAMIREGLEEAALKDVVWRHRGVMRGINNDGYGFECHIFSTNGPGVKNFRQMEDEPLALYQVSDISGKKVIENLNYIIPFLVGNDRAKFMTLDY